MSHPSYLFIGGGWDGKQEKVRSDVDVIQVPVTPELIYTFSPATNDTFPALKIETYRRIDFCGIQVFLLYSINPSDLPQLLLTNYRPSQHEQHQ